MTTTRFVGRDPANATRAAGAAQIPAAASSRQAAPWRDPFRFRAPARPDIEIWVGVAAFASVLAAWLLVTELGLVNPQFLPSPLAVLHAWRGLFQNDYLYDIGISIARVWIAFLASAAMAIPIGMLMSSYRIGRRLRAGHRFHPLSAGAGARAADASSGSASGEDDQDRSCCGSARSSSSCCSSPTTCAACPQEYVETGRTRSAPDRGSS